MKFKRKMVEVEAFKYEGDLKLSNGSYCVPEWAINAFENGILHYCTFNNSPSELFVKVEGIDDMHVSVGDYIMLFSDGAVYRVTKECMDEHWEQC